MEFVQLELSNLHYIRLDLFTSTMVGFIPAISVSPLGPSVSLNPLQKGFDHKGPDGSHNRI